MIQTIRKFGERDETVASILDAKSFNVSLSMSITADIRRVLYALAIPEYMEVWVDLPSFDHLCVEEGLSETDFRIDLFCSGTVKSSIECRCLLMTSDHLKYTWQKSGSEINRPTIVDIRIKQDEAICTVSIKHTGLASASDIAWYSELWQCSLKKLRRVLEG